MSKIDLENYICAVPTPNSNKDRIVYAGNYCIDVFNQPNYKKSIV
jgi:hypothetical protein